MKFPYDKDWLRFDIEYRSGRYIIYIQNDQVVTYPLIELTLQEQLGFTNNVTRFIKATTPDLVQSSIIELANKLAATPCQEQSND
jgi:hypothetical protein